jgi:hypothetical protein
LLECRQRVAYWSPAPLGTCGGSTDLRVDTDPTAYGNAIDEQIALLRAGIDGLFTDQADIGVLARQLA